MDTDGCKHTTCPTQPAQQTFSYNLDIDRKFPAVRRPSRSLSEGYHSGRGRLRFSFSICKKRFRIVAGFWLNSLVFFDSAAPWIIQLSIFVFSLWVNTAEPVSLRVDRNCRSSLAGPALTQQTINYDRNGETCQIKMSESSVDRPIFPEAAARRASPALKNEIYHSFANHAYFIRIKPRRVAVKFVRPCGSRDPSALSIIRRSSSIRRRRAGIPTGCYVIAKRSGASF